MNWQAVWVHACRLLQAFLTVPRATLRSMKELRCSHVRRNALSSHLIWEQLGKHMRRSTVANRTCAWAQILSVMSVGALARSPHGACKEWQQCRAASPEAAWPAREARSSRSPAAS